MVSLNLKAMIIDPDFYALRALNSYVARDRRARVVARCETLEDAYQYIDQVAEAEHPHVILIDSGMLDTPQALRDTLARLRRAISNVWIICLMHEVDPLMLSAALDGGATGFFVRNEVGVHLVSAIAYMKQHAHRLVVSRGVEKMNHDPYDVRLREARVLPKAREFPNIPERIMQALWLTVVEGMPAKLAADEMGIAPSTVQSYVKEGYRNLKSHDDTEFPEDMSPEEQAFMRLTALEDDEDDAAQ